jgi:hypothetical protein
MNRDGLQVEKRIFIPRRRRESFPGRARAKCRPSASWRPNELPVWSKRASPSRFVGPKRVNDPGIAFADLPPIDFV